jgi:hypothetical protein
VKRYRVWIRLNTYETAFVIVFAENDYLAKRIAEATYGVGNVLSYTLEE